MANDFLNHQPERIILDRLRFAVATGLGESVLASARIQEVRDIVTRQLILSLEVEVLAEKLAPETVQGERIEPKTWLDYLKRDVWYTDLAHDRIMRWVARKWPVRYRKITVQMMLERMHKYPEANIILPELGRPVIFERWQEPSGKVEDV